jgi:hypothetical protein
MLLEENTHTSEFEFLFLTSKTKENKSITQNYLVQINTEQNNEQNIIGIHSARL